MFTETLLDFINVTHCAVMRCVGILNVKQIINNMFLVVTVERNLGSRSDSSLVPT